MWCFNLCALLVDVSTVKFTAQAFVNDYIYLSLTETTNDMNQYISYITGQSSSHDNLQVISTVILYINTINIKYQFLNNSIAE